MRLDLEYPAYRYRLRGRVYTSTVKECTGPEARIWWRREQSAHATLMLRLECEVEGEWCPYVKEER